MKRVNLIEHHASLIDEKLLGESGRFNPWSHIELCLQGVRRYVNLPRRFKRAYAVITKSSHPDAFRFDESGSIEGVRAYILGSTRDYLSRAYREGHRYMRIEYD